MAGVKPSEDTGIQYHKNSPYVYSIEKMTIKVLKFENKF